VSSLATWPDGTPKSQGNAFTLCTRAVAPVVPEKVLAKRIYAAKHYAAKQAGLASIPSRDSIEHDKKTKTAQAQADTDGRHALRKGGI